jgi:hypothetical protein
MLLPVINPLQLPAVTSAYGQLQEATLIIHTTDMNYIKIKIVIEFMSVINMCQEICCFMCGFCNILSTKTDIKTLVIVSQYQIQHVTSYFK